MSSALRVALMGWLVAMLLATMWARSSARAARRSADLRARIELAEIRFVQAAATAQARADSARRFEAAARTAEQAALMWRAQAQSAGARGDSLAAELAPVLPDTLRPLYEATRAAWQAERMALTVACDSLIAGLNAERTAHALDQARADTAEAALVEARALLARAARVTAPPRIPRVVAVAAGAVIGIAAVKVLR